MSFKDCIDTAVEAGRVTATKADLAKQAYDDKLAEAVNDGLSEADAALQAAINATESLSSATRERRWAKLNEIQRADEIHTRLSTADDISDGIHEIMVDLELSFDTVMGFAMANLDELLIEYAPKLAGIRRPTAGLDEIARAAYGQTSDAKAVRMAKAIQGTMESLRQWANRYGASIPDNPNNSLFQTHDAIKVSSVSRKKWVDDHLEEGVLDWEVMRYAGKEIPTGNRQTVLESVYDAIVTDGYNRPETAQVNEAGLASRLNRDRFLYYKSGDAWNAMQEAYGAGNVHQQVIGMVDAMAKDISILMKFGPNPSSMMAYMRRDALKLAGDSDLAKGSNQRKELNRIRRRLDVADTEYEIHSRHVPTLESNLPVQTFGAVRSLGVSALLGSIFIPNFISDQINARASRNLLNMPTTKAISRYYSEFNMTPEKKQEAISSGIIFEHGIGIAGNRIRYFGMMDGPNWARNVGEFTYRAGVTSHHTQVARNAAGKNFQMLLYQHKDLEFDDLPFAAFFAEHSITPDEWNIMRSTAVHDVRGGKFIRPIDAWRQGNTVTGEKFGNAMQMFMRTAVPNTSLRGQAAVGNSLNPNTVVGQAVRSMTSLMSFPVTIYFNHLRRIQHADNRLSMMAKYFAWMTAGGMAITQAKALVTGQQPYNMVPVDEQGEFDLTDPSWLDFMGRSVVNGGSLGILGDALFNTIDLANSGYRAGNPTEQYVESLAKLTLGNAMKAVDSDRETSVAKDSLDFAQRNIPEFWQTKLLTRRYITDELLREADPAAWERKKAFEQGRENGMWWGMGEEPDF